MLRATDLQHRRLHDDPLLRRLRQEDLSAADYRAALTVFLRVLAAVEAQRSDADIWPEFSLELYCTALAREIGQEVQPGPACKLNGSARVLGALYVAHGSGFGFASLRGNVRRALPTAAPARSLDLAPRPMLWRALIAQIEDVGAQAGRFAALLAGAQQTFGMVSVVSTQVRTGLAAADARSDGPIV